MSDACLNLHRGGTVRVQKYRASIVIGRLGRRREGEKREPGKEDERPTYRSSAAVISAVISGDAQYHTSVKWSSFKFHCHSDCMHLVASSSCSRQMMEKPMQAGKCEGGSHTIMVEAKRGCTDGRVPPLLAR